MDEENTPGQRFSVATAQATDEALIQAATEATTVLIFVIKEDDAINDLKDGRIVLEGLTVRQDLDSVASASAMCDWINLSYPPRLNSSLKYSRRFS
ncbi:hypothetical protein SKAU_G00390480 [Synaphobranchus kaupii]|uniref:Uncharacterized protein n=1 Tax=Synaphobranchus kaupii TaxID=118154 RepID=A0A9Q1EBI4_SYNKA|nr:hypothetical protein SKAU_G00390480 [Synaphobranchus kaupii]